MVYKPTNTAWWFGTIGLFFHILGIIIPFDEYFSEGLKPPTSSCMMLMWLMFEQRTIISKYNIGHLNDQV